MFADVLSDDLAVLRIGVSENVLNKVIAVLITRNVDQRNAGAVETTLADTVEVATKKINTANLETFLDDLGSELVHAILGSIADDMVNCPAAISWSTVLANVLDTPVAELTVSNDVDASKHLFNTGALTVS